eukprot:TRINITY_DN5194_c0_g1_i1.p1 TRINITY_DN5194_c0_g1~~TRINITY_DN5194_c0_g1_i1.p1  ORF type:complete len:309 (-),score=44.76 TRINITY_DN5194_c0_g1_i1:82-1008(-)
MQFQPEPSASYGYGGVTPFPHKSAFSHADKRRSNVSAVLGSLVFPVALFAVVFAALSFTMHYNQSWLCWLIVFCGGCAVIAVAVLAHKAVLKRMSGETIQGPSWYIFSVLSMSLAFGVAVMLGTWNYQQNTLPFCEINSLSAYADIDVSKASGTQLMDAGRVVFSDDAKLDVSRFMSFKNVDIYCVAPIVPGNTTVSTNDLWAVGLNCCSSDFHCGEYNNKYAHSGLRLVREDQRKFYKLAVQQAEAKYTMNAPHPVFFFWMQDPITELASYNDEALRIYYLGCFGFLAFHVGAVILALVFFNKFGLA